MVGSRDWVHTGPQFPKWTLALPSCWASAHLIGSQAQTGWGPDTPGRLSHRSSPGGEMHQVSTSPHAHPTPLTPRHQALTWHTQVPFPSMPSRQVPWPLHGVSAPPGHSVNPPLQNSGLSQGPLVRPSPAALGSPRHGPSPGGSQSQVAKLCIK